MSDPVTRAAHALREQTDGWSPEAPSTRRRILSEVPRRARRRRALLAIWVPLAVVLVVSSAWAAATGRASFLFSVFRRTSGTVALAKKPGQVATSHATSDEAVATLAAPSILPAKPAPVGTIADAPAVAPIPEKPQGTLRRAASEPLDPEEDLYAVAHRAHFVDRDSLRALDAWDRYLKVFPHGRFGPEARYNRALALVRLGRLDEAREALASFVDGRSGGYRQAEARSLLDALDAGR